MLRLVESSRPGEVDAFAARCALEERLLLIRALAAAVSEATPAGAGLRVHVAVDMLRRWEESERAATAMSGEDLLVPRGYEGVFAECEAGLGISGSLEWAWTADTQGELARDLEVVAQRLEAYQLVVEQAASGGAAAGAG